MKGARIVVLGIALAAGGTAAYLVRGDDPPPPAAPPPVVQIASDDVLVAGTDIGVGQSVSAQTLRWQAWPTDAAASANFIRKKERPNAMEQIAGSIARGQFSAGEP